jgi:hypothetical protein
MTPNEVFEKYIKDADTGDKFKIYYLIKKEGMLNVAGMNFESKEPTYCLKMLSGIVNQPSFYSWIFDKEALVEAIERNKTI